MQLGEIEYFIDSIKQVTTADAVFSILAKRIEYIGFDRFAYGTIWGMDGKLNPISITSYPQGWIDHYNQQRYEPHDMVFRFAAQMVRPFMWKEIADHPGLTQEQKAIFAEANEVELRSGASFPIHGPGKIKATLSVASRVKPDEASRIFTENKYQLHLLATYTHEHIIKHISQSINTYDVSLTPKEISVLTWIAVGKTQWETSEILNCSENTIKAHLKHAFEKLKVTNTVHAVAVALVNGLIST